MLRNLVFITLFIFIAGCGTTQIESNRDVAYPKKLDRVLVYLALHNSYYNISSVEKNLSEDFAKHGISSRVVIQGLGDPLETTIKSYKPNQLMTISIGSISSYSSGNLLTLGSGTNSVLSYTVDVSLSDIALQKTIWRSAVHSGGIFTKSHTEEESLIDTIINKLEADDLLPPKRLAAATIPTGKHHD